MFKTVDINGYRGLSKFRMHGLGQINLLVGKNNGGKTSVLEMLYLLGGGGDPGIFWRMVTRRGERTFVESPGGRAPEVEYDITHLFHGHKLKPNITFSVTARNQRPASSVVCGIVESKPDDSKQPLPGMVDHDGFSAPQFFLTIIGSGKNTALPLTRRFGLRSDAIESVRRPARTIRDTSLASTQFVSTESLSSESLASLWNEIALTDAEERVLEALQFVEPRLLAIAPVVFTSPYYGYGQTRGGFIARLRGVEAPVPIGSLGDGTWRILALAIALSRAKDGMLLVDEIDTGLHHSVMGDMWRLIGRAAKDLNIQVFATTHSYDCVRSLSAMCYEEDDTLADVTIQRIESGDRDAVAYTAEEIEQAAIHNIEMR